MTSVTDLIAREQRFKPHEIFREMALIGATLIWNCSAEGVEVSFTAPKEREGRLTVLADAIRQRRAESVQWTIEYIVKASSLVGLDDEEAWLEPQLIRLDLARSFAIPFPKTPEDAAREVTEYSALMLSQAGVERQHAANRRADIVAFVFRSIETDYGARFVTELQSRIGGSAGR